VLEEQWRSKAGDERWRRPWQRVIVPGEGLANMDGQGTHKLPEGAGMLLQYLIGPEMEQKGVIDGGATRVLTAAMAARRSAGWDAGGWQGSSQGASTGWCGAAGALGRGEEALYRQVDGVAEAAAEH
jgi:hypothetical protein